MTTLQQAATAYLKDRHHDLAAVTRRAQRQRLASFVHVVGAGRVVSRLKRAHVLAWMDSRSHVQASSLRSELTTIRTFCRWLVDHDHVAKDPARGIRGPKSTEALPRRINADEARRLLEVVPDARGRVIALLGLQEGLRRGEISRLAIGDIDFYDRLLRVGAGKTRKERYVPLSEQTATAVRAYLAEWPASTGPLIRSLRYASRTIGPDRIGRLMSDWMREAGVKLAAFDGKSLHALRHTALSDMADLGADMRDVQEFAGHTELTTTQIYFRRQAAMGRIRAAAGGRIYGDNRGMILPRAEETCE